MSFLALSSSKVLAELCKLLLGNNEGAPRAEESSACSGGHCQCPGRWLLVANPPDSLWPASPRADIPTKAQGCLGAHRYYGTREPSLFSLLCSHFPTPSFRKRNLINGILMAAQIHLAWQASRVSEKMAGRWEAGSSIVAVLTRKKRKRRSTNRRWSSASMFPSGSGMGRAGCPPTHTMNNWMLRHGLDVTKDRARLGLASFLRNLPSSL